MLDTLAACNFRVRDTTRQDIPRQACDPPIPSHYHSFTPTYSPDRNIPHCPARLSPTATRYFRTHSILLRYLVPPDTSLLPRKQPTFAIASKAIKRAIDHLSSRNSSSNRNNRMIRPAPMAARSSTFAASSAYDSHASLAVSMEDFEAHEFSPTVPDLPSQHSIYRSGVSSYQSSTTSNRRSASPPAWRKAGSGWFKHQGSLSPSRRSFHSREGSLEYRSADEDADREDGEGEITVYPLPSRIPLPESPTKGRSPSPSPVPYFGGGETAVRTPAVNARPSTPSRNDANESEAPDQKTPTQMNCKFPVRRLLSLPPSLATVSSPLSSTCL